MAKLHPSLRQRFMPLVHHCCQLRPFQHYTGFESSTSTQPQGNTIGGIPTPFA